MEPRTRAELLRDLREHAPSIDLAGIIARHDSPLVVIDPSSARARLAELTAELPFVHVHYAVTALPHPSIVQALWGAAGFAISDVRELDLLEAAGVPADGALLTTPVTAAAHIARAYAAGVRTFVVDNPVEVDKYAGMPKDLRVLVRVAVGPSSAASAFGIAPERVVNLVRYALSAGVNVSGLSFHLGRDAASPAAVETAIGTSLALIDDVEHDLGVRLGTLDIGGGLPGDGSQRRAGLASVSAVIRRLRPHGRTRSP